MDAWSGGWPPVSEPVRALLRDGQGLWLAPGEARAPHGCVVVATSGTSGAAKPVILSREALAAAADAAHERLGFTATWHLALPPQHVAGLMVVVRGLLGAGVRLAGTSLAELDLAPGRNAISLVPTQLFRAMRHPDTAATLARFDAVLVGGAALGAQLRAQAESAAIPLIETYGMSETSGGVVWDHRPLPRVRLQVRGDGRIAIAGRMLFSGYHDEPEATAAALDGGWLLTQDRGHLIDGRLYVDGRLDEMIVSGGVNVDLAEVRRVVAGVDPEAAVIAVPDEEWGARVVLCAASGTLEGWRKRLRGRLPAAALPRQLLQAEVPRTTGGKPDVQELLKLSQP